MSPWTCLLHGVPPDPLRLGGKGASLVRLCALGLEVPGAFIIEASAFRAQLSNPALRDALLQAPLPHELVKEIEGRLMALGDVSLAVRSSAVAEDSAERSFAGMHESVLGVRGINEVLDAVRRCWASAFSERALRYREAAGLPEEAAHMAVVVQRLVHAEHAGVLFTLDPSGGEAMICEAVEGLGESLVSGRANPARWRIRRKEPTILSREEGGCTLDEGLILELARLGLRVEEAFGAPQDIEWALAEGRIHVLQARPIMTLRTSKEDRVVWSNTNVGELLPEVCTPMAFAVARRFVEDLMGALTQRLGLDLRRMPLLGLVGGRVYANMNAVAALLRRMPGMKGKSYADFFGGDQVALREAMSTLREEDLPEAKVYPWAVAARMPGFLFWILSRAFRPLPSWIEGFGDEGRALAPTDLGAIPDKELPRRIDKLLSFMLDPERSDGMAYAFVSTGSASLLARACRSWFHDEDGSMGNRLLSGLGGVASAEAALDLWRLADSARELGLQDRVLESTDFELLSMSLSETPQGRAFLERWEAFLLEHGHHARGELDVAIPRWSEQPDYLLSMLRGYLQVPADAGALVVHERGALERGALEERCRRVLGPIRRRIFNALLVRAQRGVAIREGAKSEFVRRISYVRRILLEAGGRLCSRGRIPKPEDIFFLDLEELPAALEVPDKELRTVISQRRAEYLSFKDGVLPPVIVGRFDPRRHLPPPPAVDVYHGISVSPGIVEGPARVILASDSGERVLPGEIPVAPFTDPGWTPYFLTTAAIVMDQGGVLSHGAVVAREVGIPAVVNVGPATRCIRSGQRLRVDAFRGEVRVLE